MFQNDAYRSSLRKYRQPPGPIPTLADMTSSGSAHWFWAGCGERGCLHCAALPWASVIARLGSDADADRLRAALTCTRCGHRGGLMWLVTGSRHGAPAPPIPAERVPAWVAKDCLRRIGV